MRKALIPLVALTLLGGATAFAATDINQPRCGGSQCQVDITAPPTSRVVRLKKPTRQRVRTPPSQATILHWSTVSLPGYCNVIGERVVTSWANPGKTVPSFVNGGGSQTLRTSELLDQNNQSVEFGQIIKVCGSNATPPSPPRAQDVWNQVSGQFSVDNITISPTTKGLTGLPTKLSAAITNPGTVTLNDSNYQVNATITIESIQWDMGEDGVMPSGPSPTYIFQSKGLHQVRVNVVFKVVYQVSGLATYQRTFLTPALSQTRPYQVVELRAIPALAQ